MSPRSSADRAFACGAKGRVFESPRGRLEERSNRSFRLCKEWTKETTEGVNEETSDIVNK